MKSMSHKPIRLFLLIQLCFLLLCCIPANQARAAQASKVSVSGIDYDNLTMKILANGNSIVYYSVDQSTWYQVEAAYSSTLKAYTMDISWIAYTKDVTVYLKGNIDKNVYQITLPMQNKSFSVKYDKAEGEFDFSETEDADTFQWRKSTDYHWNEVDLDEDASSYQKFIKNVEKMKTMGAKLIFRTPQAAGSDNEDVGRRPSREVTVTIPKRANAPSVKVNVSKLNLNTTEAMEYYDEKTGLWLECLKAMTLEDIAPQVLYSNGAKTASLQIRTAPTLSNTYSKTAYLTIPGQSAAPTVGDNSKDVTYYYQNSKLILGFCNATSTNPFEYAVVRAGYEFNAATASWRTVTSSKLMTISKLTAPDGCTIYVRKKGIEANAANNISMSLASATGKISVKYP